MRKLLMYVILIALVSCTEMHNPILHGDGTIKFIPNVEYEVDSIVIQRMEQYFELNWKKEMFVKELNDFHISWYNKNYTYNIDFIDESDCVTSFYGDYDIIWYTNRYNNNLVNNNIIYTENINDSVCKIPDFVYSKKGNIHISDNLHDYTLGENQYIKVFRDTLLQRTFLYIVQVKLKNNNDRVKDSGTFCISGLAKKLNLKNELNSEETCYIFNTQIHNDIIVGNFISFGVPGWNPYDFRYKFRNDLIISYTNKNILHVQLIYNRGKKLIEFDVSDQIALQPTGGLLLIEIDVNDYPEPNSDMTDPFNVFVEDYENIEQYYNKF